MSSTNQIDALPAGKMDICYTETNSTLLNEQDRSDPTWRAQQEENIPIERKLRIVTSSRVPAWLPEAVNSLNTLLALADNWDSYDACKVRHEATLAAIQVLLFVMEEQTPLPSIVPVPSGDIQLEWHRFGIDLEVEITSSREYSISFEDELGEIEPHEDDATRQSIYDYQPLLQFINLITGRASTKG